MNKEWEELKQINTRIRKDLAIFDAGRKIFVNSAGEPSCHICGYCPDDFERIAESYAKSVAIEELEKISKVTSSRERVFGKDRHGNSGSVGIDYHHLVKVFSEAILALKAEGGTE